MPRAKSVVKHDEIVRAGKALAASGATIGKLLIFPDHVEIVPNYGDLEESTPAPIDKEAGNIPLLAQPS